MSKITEMQMKIAELLQANEAAMTLVEQLTAERDTLAAQVEDLLAHGTALATAASMATGAMAIGSPVTAFCVEAVKRFNAASQYADQIRREGK